MRSNFDFMTWNSAQQKEARQSALCAAFWTAGTVMVLEFFRIPNSYMALSFASTLTLLPRPSLSHALTRLLSLSLGIISSMLVLTAVPEASTNFILTRYKKSHSF